MEEDGWLGRHALFLAGLSIAVIATYVEWPLTPFLVTKSGCGFQVGIARRRGDAERIRRKLVFSAALRLCARFVGQERGRIGIALRRKDAERIGRGKHGRDARATGVSATLRLCARFGFNGGDGADVADDLVEALDHVRGHGAANDTEGVAQGPGWTMP